MKNVGLDKRDSELIFNELVKRDVNIKDENNKDEIMNKLKGYSNSLPLESRKELFVDLQHKIKDFNWYILEYDSDGESGNMFLYFSSSDSGEYFVEFDLNNMDEQLELMLSDKGQLTQQNIKDQKFNILKKYIEYASCETEDQYIYGVGNITDILNEEYQGRLDELRSNIENI